MTDGKGKGSRGVFLTVDMSFSLLLMFLLILVAWYYFSKPVPSSFQGSLLRSAMQDAANIMDSKGYLSDPLDSANNSNTSGIRAVMRAMPGSYCLQVEAYSITVKDDLQGYWKLDETGGYSAADSSGNGITGAISGTAAFLEDGRAGRAISFNGVNTTVNLSDSSELNPKKNSFSIAFWMNATAAQKNGVGSIFTKYSNSAANPGYGVDLQNSSGKVRACFYYASGTCNDGAGEVLSNSDLRNGWHHVVAVFDRSADKVSLYVDGTQQATTFSGIASAGSIQNNQSGYIGADYVISGGFGNQFTGALDDVRFYKKALLQSEVSELYANSANLVYAVHTEGCLYRRDGVQVVSTTFSRSTGAGDEYHTAVMRGWLKGE